MFLRLCSICLIVVCVLLPQVAVEAGAPNVSIHPTPCCSIRSDTHFRDILSDELPRAISEHLHDETELNSSDSVWTPASITQIPENINVAITPYADCTAWMNAGQPVARVETIPFKDYVKDVLRNEWLHSWHPQALRAGAVAVKIYAWRKINIGARFYLKNIHNLDKFPHVVDNTCDQRYVANSRVASTNDAVDATWNYRLIKNGSLLQGYYLATKSQCLRSPYQPCMPQWETQFRALEGKTWQEIVQQYYGPLEISLAYLPDVPIDYVFFTHIKSLVDDGIVHGFSDGSFRPERFVTRGEMAKFIANAYQLDSSANCGQFADVPATHMFFTEIMKLKCLGISSGLNGLFLPNNPITREEATKFVMFALRVKKGDPHFARYYGSDIRFQDVPDNATFYEVIMAASSIGIVSGYDDVYFRPQEFTTRGAMSKMIQNARVL